MHGCAAEDGSYTSSGLSAELFEGTFKKGRHYVSESGIPVWEVHDNSGAVKGSVEGRALTKVVQKPEASDGGFGSVDSVLYVTYDAEGGSLLMTLHCHKQSHKNTAVSAEPSTCKVLRQQATDLVVECLALTT